MTYIRYIIQLHRLFNTQYTIYIHYYIMAISYIFGIIILCRKLFLMFINAEALKRITMSYTLKDFGPFLRCFFRPIFYIGFSFIFLFYIFKSLIKTRKTCIDRYPDFFLMVFSYVFVIILLVFFCK